MRVTVTVSPGWRRSGQYTPFPSPSRALPVRANEMLARIAWRMNATAASLGFSPPRVPPISRLRQGFGRQVAGAGSARPSMEKWTAAGGAGPQNGLVRRSGTESSLDSPLERDGFELLVPRHKSRGFPQHSEHGGVRRDGRRTSRAISPKPTPTAARQANS